MKFTSAFPFRRSLPFLALPLLGLVACGGDCCDDEVWYVESGYQTRAVAIADVQGDGRAAVISANRLHGQGLPHPGFITVRLQDPLNAGRFLDPIESDTGHDPVALALADLTGGTGRPDLVVAHRQIGADPSATTSISVQKHDSTRPGRFLAPTPLSLGTRNPTDLALGDLNHDGLPDIAVAADGADSVVAFQQNGDGTFASSTLPAGGVPSAVAVADLNHDGYLDLVAATTGGTVSVLIQDGANPGAFLPIQNYAVGSGPVAVCVAALTDEDYPDILTANFGTPSAPTTKGLSVLPHDPDHPGRFLASITHDAGDYLSSSVAVARPVVAGGTGLPMVIVANQGEPGLPGSLSVFPVSAAGALSAPMRYEGAYGPSRVAVGALPDPAVVAADGGTFLRWETSPGAFGSLIQLRQ